MVACMYTNTRTEADERYMHRHTYMHTDRQTFKHTKHTHTHALPVRDTYIQPNRHSHTGRQRDRQSHINRQTERLTDTHIHIQTHRQTDRQADRHTRAHTEKTHLIDNASAQVAFNKT